MKYPLPKIIGVLNLSPESQNNRTDVAADLLDRAQSMIADGADYLDLGAQSSRPGVAQISLAEETKRVTGAISKLKSSFPNVLLSIDTTRSEIVSLAIQEGIDMVNDISGGRFNEQLLKEVAAGKAEYVLMHSQGTFSDMHKKYEYTDIVSEIKEYFRERISVCMQAGIRREKIILDPGIGFSKSGEQNSEIVSRLHEFHELGLPLYIGLSRKRFIGSIIGEDESEKRDNATTVLHTLCIQRGANYIRTHNVKYLRETLQVLSSV